MVTKGKITAFVMAAALGLAAPLVYADNGNGGIMSGGQSAVTASQPAAPDQSQDRHDGDHQRWGHHHKGGMLFKDLTDDQKKQLKDIFRQYKQSMRISFDQMKTNRDILEQELSNPTPDMNKINQVQTQIKALQAQMADDHLNNMLAIKKILSPEQFNKFLEFKKHQMFAHRHGGWMKEDKGRDQGRCDWKHKGHGHDHDGGWGGHQPKNGDDEGIND